MRRSSPRVWMLNLALALSLVLTLFAVSGLSFGPTPDRAAAQQAQTTLEGKGTYVTLVASAARTATGTGTTFCQFAPFTKFAAQLAVTAASGTTPTLDVTWQHSIDNGTTWFTVSTFTQKTATGNELKVEAEVAAATAEVYGNCMRAIWTIGGTSPSFTFSVKAFAQ